MGNFTPNDQSMASWVSALGQGQRGFNAVASGIGAGARMTGDTEAAGFKNNVTAAKAGYDDATNRDILDSRDLTALRTSAGRATGSGAAGLEKILPLYGKVLNSVSQQAKDMQFSDPAERTAWIRQRTDEIVGSAVQQFGGNVSPAVLERLHNESQPSDVTSTPLASASIASVRPTRTASNEISVASAPAMQITPKVQEARDAAGNRLRSGEVSGDLQDWPKMPVEPSTPMTAAERAKFSQLTPQGAPPFANKPNEMLMKSGAEGMGKVYSNEYTTLTENAAAAKDQVDAYNSLEKLDPNTNMFANAQGYIGNALQGLGVDPNSPIIQDAIKNKEATALISQMSNAALRGEKGVQTRSDEVRIGKELAQTTDPKQAWNYLIGLGKERALRKMSMGESAAANAAENNGVPIAPRQTFINSVKDDPLTQDFGGKLIFRSPTIAAFLRKYPDADEAEAVDYWRSLEKNWKSRQGAK